jgi:hypothetical protein
MSAMVGKTMCVSFYLVGQWDAKLSQRADIRVRMLMVVVKPGGSWVMFKALREPFIGFGPSPSWA